MNILLTSVGRRSYLIKYFKDVPEVDLVHVCNSEETVAFHYADKAVVSPMIYDDGYIPFLLDYCKENKIDLVLSLFDIDLPVLAANRDKFEEIGVKLIVSDKKVIDICNDKWKTYEFLKENGFNVPKTYLTLEDTLAALKSGEISYPIIIKPRFGCGSLAMSTAEDEDELMYYYKRNVRAVSRTYLKYESGGVEDKIIFQEKLGGQEHGVDIINDLNGNFQNAIVKKKIAMRAGETDIAETVNEPEVEKAAARLGRVTGHIANMDCDIFLVDGKAYVLEMNARFGGGYPFSHIAGVNLPQAIVKWAKGETVPYEMLSAKCGVKAYKEIEIKKVGE